MQIRAGQAEGRRSALRALAGGIAALLLHREAMGETSLSFDKPVTKVDGPFASVGKRLTDELRGRLGPGGKAQQYLDDYLLRRDTSAPGEIYALAKGGDSKARTVLGYMLDNGIGTARNAPKALEYFASASYDEDLAQYNLGVMIMNGRGNGSPDVDTAMSKFMKVKRIPHAFVLMTENALHRGQGAIALVLAKNAYKLRDAYGTYLYARLLIEKGESRDGAKIMEGAAQDNVPQAIDAMVAINSQGIGTEVNPAMAAGWWIVGQVLVRGAAIDQALDDATRFQLSRQDYASARRFAAKWLINRKPYVPTDYTKTLTYSELKKRPA